VRDGGSWGSPRVERYLAGLGKGVDGLPGAKAKGSLVRSVLEGQPAAELTPRLPPQVRPVVVEPPVGSAWVPETYFATIFHAVADLRGLSDADVLAWSRARNRALFSNPVYRLLMAVGSPAAMLRHAGLRWSQWHRGSALAFEGFSDAGAWLSLTFPAGLYDRLLLSAFGEALAAALEMGGATDPVVRVESEAAGVARYLARW
jgi:hypothetical protein